MTVQFHFQDLWNGGRWQGESCVIVDEAGTILEISEKLNHEIPAETVFGYAIPALTNAHSHAFQYAMRGVSQCVGLTQKNDDFWSWREAMYQLAERISLEQLEIVATRLYAEMVAKGYGKVIEFHYLHNKPGGSKPANQAAFGEVLMKAAQRANIDLLLIPVYYNCGGFDQPLQGRQRRFGCASLDNYRELLQATRELADKYTRADVGYGVHSLRAANVKDTIQLLGSEKGPCHLHIAEQVQEVADCLALRGSRPVEWLLKNCDVNADTHLVHATHITQQEIEHLVECQASVALCPTTEADLGDGFFPLERYLDVGGIYSIGSDSHITINPFDELRWLEYGVRLRRGKRNPVTQPGENTGEILYRAALSGGHRASGKTADEEFVVGERFNATVLNANEAFLQTTEHRLSTMIFSFEDSYILGRIYGDHWIERENIDQIWQETVSQLR